MWILGVIVFIFLLVLSIAGIWFFWAPPITKNHSEQQGSGNISLKAEAIIGGLTNPWDVAFTPDGTLLFSERRGAVSKVVDGEKVLVQRIDDIRAQGEGGLTGMTLDSDFANNRYIHTCYNSSSNDVRVVRWTLNRDATELENKTVIVEGIPSNASGRHSGCRIKSAKDGKLWIGTGEAAQSSIPQNL